MNKPELAKEFANLIADEGLKAWAKGSAVQLRIASAPKDKADEAWAELPSPDKPKDLRAGHVWGRLWVARQNTRLSDRSTQVKVVTAWPTPIVPFGKAGIALGLQDK